MPARRPLRVFALSLFAVVLALACAAPASADIRRDFFSFNVCGNRCTHGGIEVADAIYTSINDLDQHRPHAVMLQEICRNQYEHLRVRLANQSGPWPMYGAFLPARSDVPDCGTTGEFGNAVFVRGTILDVDPHTFAHQDSEGGEQRNMVCVKVNWGRDVRACSVHLTSSDEECSAGYTCRWLQSYEVQHETARYMDNGVPVVVGGDFNARPTWNTLDLMYAGWIFGSPANGRFKEVDQFHEDPNHDCRCGEVTWASEKTDAVAKYDYIFLSASHWDFPGGYATSSQYSDHHPLRGNAMLNGT